MNFYTRVGKCCLDLTLASIGVVVLSPVLLAAALAVRLTSAGPILFRQVRVGRDGRPFRIFKFRTMYVDRAAADSLLTASGDSRITSVGRFLRSAKIDELSQLFNVLVGDMSLVGPRPEVPKYVAMYTDAQRRVLSVKPGVTGPAANMLEEELLAGQADAEQFYLTTVLPAKLRIDCDYIETVSLKTDLELIFSTAMKVVRRIGELCRPPASVEHKQI
jgi:lipopolysaccharide/colanic/teichoic acid biosynthesis glycosyltransferase